MPRKGRQPPKKNAGKGLKRKIVPHESSDSSDDSPKPGPSRQTETNVSAESSASSPEIVEAGLSRQTRTRQTKKNVALQSESSDDPMKPGPSRQTKRKKTSSRQTAQKNIKRKQTKKTGPSRQTERATEPTVTRRRIIETTTEVVSTTTTFHPGYIEVYSPLPFLVFPSSSQTMTPFGVVNVPFFTFGVPQHSVPANSYPQQINYFLPPALPTSGTTLFQSSAVTQADQAFPGSSTEQLQDEQPGVEEEESASSSSSEEGK